MPDFIEEDRRVRVYLKDKLKLNHLDSHSLIYPNLMLLGHKAHPKSIRLGYIREWESKWFNLREMPDFIEEDRRVRVYLKDKLKLNHLDSHSLIYPNLMLLGCAL
ncbi:MAG: hypothetical protein LE168_03865, partial [Endomicrobium sp.]|nr:hypothetical protein [Endomicrobium sp.]